MTFDDFIVSFKEIFPPYCKTIKKLDIYSYTEYFLDELLRLLDDLNEEEYESIGTTKTLILNNTTHQKKQILSAINNFCDGDIVECYETIFKEYFWNDGLIKYLSYKPIPAHGPLFRLRFNKSNQPFNQGEMFHIPFNKTHLVNNQRFSLSGYPCLYLGNSAYGCWEELERLDLERCNFSVFTTEREMNMFDLSLPIEIKSLQDILRLPLIISCAIKITYQEASFKPEYIIPQSVLQGVIRLNSKKVASTHFDGIIYLSSKVGERVFFSDENLMFNYVFPIIDRSEKSFCSVLKKMFTISTGVTYQELWLKYPHLVAAFDESAEIKVGTYDNSVFDKIEKYLKGKTVQKSFLD